MTTPNTNPATDVAVEARIDELMRTVDEVAELETDATLLADKNSQKNPAYVAADAKHVEARNKLKDAIRAALARPQEVAGVTPIAHLKAQTSSLPWNSYAVCSPDDGNAIPVFRAPVAVGVEPDYSDVTKWLDKNLKRVGWSIEDAMYEINGAQAHRLAREFATPAPSVPLGGGEAKEPGPDLSGKAAVNRLFGHLDRSRAHPLQAQDAAPVEPPDVYSSGGQHPSECPFCGSYPRLIDLAGWEIDCSCGASMVLESADKEKLVTKWNRRAPVPAGVQGDAARLDGKGKSE